ncbi:hypothetical protein [Enterococcus hirae]|uniref:hypothetical protein n=1 Tax=Enterococcus hirae TaxID=1354 RepID=UPI003F46CE5A
MAGCYLLSMFTKVAEYSPFYLTTASNALGERIDSSNYTFSLMVTGLMIAAFLVTGILFFNKKES